MTANERKEAEDQLTAILNRALKNVPLVKLDAVEDVIKLFTEAIDLMEASQQVDDDAAVTTTLPTPASHTQSNLVALAGTPSTATTAANSSASSSDSEADATRGLAHPPVNKSISGIASAAMTVDYSSPSSKTRSLGAKPGPKENRGSTGLGLGLGNKSSTGQTAPKQGVLGLGHGGHKPSSRATTGLNALNSQGTSSPVSPTTPDSANDETQSPAAATTPAGGENAPTGPLKNKLVAKLATSQREYPSPKLGPRSLSSASKPASASASPVNPAASGLSLPMPDSLGRDAPAPVPSGAASPDADDETENEEPDESEAGDLILTDKKNSVFNRVKSTLPVTASPKQIRSSFLLLDLATSQQIAPEDDDLTMGQQNVHPTGPGDRAVGPGGVLSALPTGLQASSTNNTPKPSYLRRLDSPETHHGQLLAAKARLQMLLNKGIQLADRVNLAAVPEIKAKLEKALAKLEASLVQTTITPLV